MSDTENITRLEAAIRSLEGTIGELREKKTAAKVLVVDDDESDVILLRRVLDKFHCVVTVCNDSHEAEALIKAEQFDVIFLDQRMPKLNGLEILQRIIPGSAAQYFIVSGFPESAIMRQAAEFGAVFVPKPVSYRMLATFLRPKDERTEPT